MFVPVLQVIFFAVECFGMSAGNETFRFETVVQNVEQLTRFASGIVLQSQLHSDFTNVTAYFLKFEKNQFLKFRKFPTGKVHLKIKSLYERSQEIYFDPKMKQVHEGLKWMEPMMKITGKLEDSLNKEEINKYIDKIDSLQSRASMFENLRFKNYKQIFKCFMKVDSRNRVMECFEILKHGQIILRDLQKTLRRTLPSPEINIFFNRIQNIVNSYQPVQLLAAAVNLMELFSNVNASVKGIEDAVKRIGEQFNRSKTRLNELTNQMNVHDALDTLYQLAERSSEISLQQESLDNIFPNTEDINKLFSDLETKWMKNLVEVSVGKNGVKKMKRALEPLEKYTHRVIEISNILKKLFQQNWGLTAENLISVFTEVELLESWLKSSRVDGHFSVPPYSFEPFLKCVNKLPQLSNSVNQEIFMKLMRQTEEFYRQLEQWNELSSFNNKTWFISFIKNQYISVDTFLKSLSDEKDIDTIKREMEKMQEDFLSTESDEFVAEMDYFLEKKISVLERLFEEGFIQNLQSHPDMSLFTETIDQIRENEIFPLINCYLQEKKTFSTLSKIINGASKFNEFSDHKVQMEWFFSFLNELSQAQKLLNDTEQFITSWQTDGVLKQESKKMIEFGTGHDVAGRLWSGFKSLKMMEPHFENQKLFESLASLEVDETNGEFARRWVRSYRNGTIQLIKDMKKMEEVSRKYGNGEYGLKGVFEMFTQASKIRGVLISWRGVDRLRIKSIQEFMELENRNDLDFSSHSEHLNSAAHDVTTLREFLESFRDPILLQANFPVFTVLLILGSLLASIFLILVVGFFLTSNGRKRWRKFYLARWGSKEDLEQCWRYSFWTDQVSNKNMLCEAVREINYDHVKTLVGKGAYINPYNNFGNTPLHASTKYGHVKIVEILLMNGADRGAYNTDNRTPEQMNEVILKDVTSNASLGAANQKKRRASEDIERLYRKYDNLTFRPRIPDLLPTMAYHNVEYMGKIYNTVETWARWVHKQCIPFLFGVQFYMTNDAHSDASVVNQLKPLVEMHGATLCDEMPLKENYNPGSHPFHHFHMGPIFIIHAAKDHQFEQLRNDNLFTLMTIQQFIVFMLEMQVMYDPERKEPIPVKNEDFTTLHATTSELKHPGQVKTSLFLILSQSTGMRGCVILLEDEAISTEEQEELLFWDVLT
uniref:ANK_REP_REGION domain-containing protein n=2 Tax=Caenorhabditis japonica TaxID=281687 RepID=A0A8R1HQE8_CAEJA